MRTRDLALAIAGAFIVAGATITAVGAQDAAPVRIAVNPWVGSASNVAVAKYLIEEKLGIPVEVLALNEGIDWQGFETGEVDAILEVWGHDADRATFIDEKQVAQDVASFFAQNYTRAPSVASPHAKARAAAAIQANSVMCSQIGRASCRERV